MSSADSRRLPVPGPLTRRSLLRLALLPAAAAGLSACGFQLRGVMTFSFSSLFSGFPDTSDMGEYFLQSMAVSAPSVRILTLPQERAQAQVILDVLEERRAKTVATYNAAGEAREFTLRSTLRFQLRAADGQLLIGPTPLGQSRDMSFTESAALAKEMEEQALFRDMEADLVQQLMRLSLIHI